MDSWHILLAFLGSSATTATITTAAWAVGRQMGKRRLEEIRQGGELRHWSTSIEVAPTEIDWAKWGPGEMAPLWRLMERDGLKPVGNPADPALLMRLIREMDDQQRRYRDDLIRRGALGREESFTERYELALKSIRRQDEQPALFGDSEFHTSNRVKPFSRGRELALGGSYILAFGQMPLSPVRRFDQRLGAAVSRIGAAAVTVERRRDEEQRRTRRVDGR